MKTELPFSYFQPFALHLRPVISMDEDQFFDFCQINEGVRIERTAEGVFILLPLFGGYCGARNAAIAGGLDQWAGRDGEGVVFNSSTGFLLPNGAVRTPDASWVLRSRLTQLTAREWQRFLPLCPDFLIEVRSPSDYLPMLIEKMEEYQANGARLGWLIDPILRRVSIYAEGSNVPTVLESPDFLQGDPILPGFTLPLVQIWEPDF